jgi:hypothetical protein
MRRMRELVASPTFSEFGRFVKQRASVSRWEYQARKNALLVLRLGSAQPEH